VLALLDHVVQAHEREDAPDEGEDEVHGRRDAHHHVEVARDRDAAERGQAAGPEDLVGRYGVALPGLDELSVEAVAVLVEEDELLELARHDLDEGEHEPEEGRVDEDLVVLLLPLDGLDDHLDDRPHGERHRESHEDDEQVRLGVHGQTSMLQILRMKK
jgi:hypothetical protein